MGMNYYVKINTKEAIQDTLYVSSLVYSALDNFELHIGKSSYGWKFVFQQQEIYNPLTKDFTKLISYRTWKEFLTTAPVVIVNECNEEINKGEFFKMVEEKQNEVHPNIEEELMKEVEYLDPEGYRIQIGEFT